MSTSASPVVSPRKGKHVRSGVSTMSHTNQLGTELNNRPNGISSLPSGVDINTLDPDDAFVKLSIREIQSIEANLQASHEQLSQTLKSLVAERYRDMLGTANTLIEMSSSASNLVTRLDAVRQGVTTTEPITVPEVSHDTDLSAQNEEHNETSSLGEKDAMILAIASATKLLAEAPDEIWRAIEGASEAKMSFSSHQSSQSSIRRHRNHRAANILKAAFIIVLCQKTWEWLSTSAHFDEAELIAKFPFISNQWLAVQLMRSQVASAARQGLAGWYEAKVKTTDCPWDELSSSYIASLTYMLADAMTHDSNLTTCRSTLLDMRGKAIIEQLNNHSMKSSHTLARSIRCIADTMVHCLQAFGQNDEDSDSSHAGRIFETISSGSRVDTAHFPPKAADVIDTLPSGDILTRFLPKAILEHAPTLHYDDASKCQQTTLQFVQDWSSNLRTECQSRSYKQAIDRIGTISAIGEAQILIRESLDRSLSRIGRLIKKKDLRGTLIEEIVLFVKLMEELLLKRADVLCKERTAELSLAISESTSSALKSLLPREQVNGMKKESKGTMEMEKMPILFSLSSDDTSASMQDKLRLHTPLVQQVLSSVEARAQILAREMSSYSAYIESDAAKRRRRKGAQRNGVGGVEDISRQVAAVLESYRTAFDLARLLLVDELKGQLVSRQNIASGSVIHGNVQNLYVARIASALQKSNVLRSTATVATKSNDEVFLQRLAILRSEIINDWISKSVSEAMDLYRSRAEAYVQSEIDNDNQGRPSTALAEALLRLVECFDAIGCGYQSEATLLGKQVLVEFVNLWLKKSGEMKAEKNKPCCYTFDTQVLLVLTREHSGVENQIQALTEIRTALDGDVGEEKQIEVAIQRLRLILHPLRPDQQVPQDAEQGRKGPSQISHITSAAQQPPPLPMLTLVASRDKVPLF